MSVPGVDVATPAADPAVEGEPVEEQTTVVDAPAEGETPAPTEEEAAAAAAKLAAEKPVEIPEDVLRAAAIKHANRTMAAARRAESAVATVKAENESLRAKVADYDAFVTGLRANPFAAIKRLGFSSVKEFIDAGINAGEPKEPTSEDRVTALERLIRERDEKEAAKVAQQTVGDTQAKVFKALEAMPERYDVVNTKIGRREVWDGVIAYHAKHGQVPDAAVFAIADGVERELANDVSTARRFKASAGPGATKQGTAPATAPGARTSGRTITNSSTSGAPTTKVYSDDPEERRRQVNEDMRAAGEL